MCNSEWALSLEVSDLVMTFYRLGRRMDHRSWRPRMLGSQGAWLVWKRAGCQHPGVWLSTLPNSEFWQAVRFQWKLASNWWFIASAFKTASLLPDGVWGELCSSMLPYLASSQALFNASLLVPTDSAVLQSQLSKPFTAKTAGSASCKDLTLWVLWHLLGSDSGLFLTSFWRGTLQLDHT